MSDPHAATSLALEDWLRRIETLHPKKIDLSLDRVQAVLRALDVDRPPYRVLSIGGTNGKGSCVALLERIYGLAGYRVGAYTSPHLFRFNERVRVGGADASDTDLISAFEAIDRARGTTTLSYFEYATVAACLHFAWQGAEIVVLEVGLGGRLDAVNALDADLALIASIDLDHQRWLGSTREAIGLEKAGILRAGRPAILGDRDPPPAVLDHASQLGAVLWRAGVDFDVSRRAGGDWSYRGRARCWDDLPRPALAGEVQYDNAAACLAAVESLKAELPVARDVVESALESVQLRGRLELARRDGVEWVFDVAHNPSAATRLADELRRRPVAGCTLAVVGLMADKDIDGVLEPLVALVDAWLATRADSERAADADVLVAALSRLGARNAQCASSPAQACELAAARARPGDRVVVFGSFHIVGPAMASLELYSVASSSGETSAKWTVA